MRKLLVVLAVLVLLGANNLAAGGGKEAAPGGTIRIGMVAALSGPSASMGKALPQGIDLAIEEINAAGGVLGRKLEVFYRDDEGDPTKAKNMAEELVDREKVIFMLGPVNSTSAVAIAPYLTENKIVNIISIATSDAAIDPVKYPYSFRTMPPNGLQAEALALIAKAGGYRRVAIVGDTSALGVDGLAQLDKHCAANGITPVARVSYTPGDPDMTPVAQAIANAQADYALLWTLGADGARLVRALERIGYHDKLEMLGYTGLSLPNFRELAGPAANKVYSINQRAWTVPTPTGRLNSPFRELYDKVNAKFGTYGTGPGKRDTNPYHVASAYDSVYLIKFAVEKAGGTDPDAIKRVLETQGGEYKSFMSIDSYNFSAAQHNGFRPTEMVPYLIGEFDTTNRDLPVRK